MYLIYVAAKINLELIIIMVVNTKKTQTVDTRTVVDYDKFLYFYIFLILSELIIETFDDCKPVHFN